MKASMVSAMEHIYSILLSTLLFSLSVSTSTPEPIPAVWPEQFHSLLFMNRSGILHQIDLWYDWPNGRNFNIIQYQLNEVVSYDLEWNNGTSFIYTLHPSDSHCEVEHLDVGILRPNWLDGATYLGQEKVDNFVCNVWEKVDFIVYYEDVLTRRPVKWVFYTGYTAHVMTFEVGAVLEDPKWQAPVYCFNQTEKEKSVSSLLESTTVRGDSFWSLMRGKANAAA
ncbi:transferring glycosyl group transferase [Trifolium pratense]|uniref:Transferring glycosyl group transferase n=1 Tax=Trifolium pratense TaxID=57577 RepID=A0A2K3NEU5_TRIPR|nr:transferring glycosyl group transferase [Trifolium pratense]